MILYESKGGVMMSIGLENKYGISWQKMPRMTDQGTMPRAADQGTMPRAAEERGEIGSYHINSIISGNPTATRRQDMTHHPQEKVSAAQQTPTDVRNFEEDIDWAFRDRGPGNPAERSDLPLVGSNSQERVEAWRQGMALRPPESTVSAAQQTPTDVRSFERNINEVLGDRRDEN